MGPNVALRCPPPSRPSSGFIGSKGIATRVEKTVGYRHSKTRVSTTTRYRLPRTGLSTRSSSHGFSNPPICLGSVFALSLLSLLLYPCVSSDCPARVFRSSVVHHCFTEDKRANESVGRKDERIKRGQNTEGLLYGENSP